MCILEIQSLMDRASFEDCKGTTFFCNFYAFHTTSFAILPTNVVPWGWVVTFVSNHKIRCVSKGRQKVEKTTKLAFYPPFGL